MNCNGGLVCVSLCMDRMRQGRNRVLCVCVDKEGCINKSHVSPAFAIQSDISKPYPLFHHGEFLAESSPSSHYIKYLVAFYVLVIVELEPEPEPEPKPELSSRSFIFSCSPRCRMLVPSSSPAHPDVVCLVVCYIKY